MHSIRAAVVTVSDKGYAGEREDASGPLLASLLRGMGAEVESETIVPDQREEMRKMIENMRARREEKGSRRGGHFWQRPGE